MNKTELAFFRPKWRRITATMFCIGWTAVEFLTGQPFWGVIAAGITVYCLWHLFYVFEETQSSEN